MTNFGKDEIYVVSSAQPAAGEFTPRGGKWRVSSNGGVRVRWRRDGQELFYLSPGGIIMAVTAERQPSYEKDHKKENRQPHKVAVRKTNTPLSNSAIGLQSHRSSAGTL